MKEGLYNKAYEKDACGIGFIANIDNQPTHKTVHDALVMLHKMEHRGGVAADDTTGWCWVTHTDSPCIFSKGSTK